MKQAETQRSGWRGRGTTLGGQCPRVLDRAFGRSIQAPGHVAGSLVLGPLRGRRDLRAELERADFYLEPFANPSTVPAAVGFLVAG